MTTTARATLELFSSMRFAISLLTVIAIASVIGTVLQQNLPYSSYLNQFGPFWFPLFERLGLYSVYGAGWFLAILAFLVASTSVCVYRNTPKMLREMRAWRDNLRERSFANFGLHDEVASSGGASVAVERLSAYLRAQGYALRTIPSGEGTLVSAKAGSLRRLGYVFTHVGIVVICVGGLLDGDLGTKWKLATGEKQLLTGNVLRDAVPPTGRMPVDNWSYRGNMLVAEGGSNDIAILNIRDGALVQDIPFSIALKRFQIEHYSTGQPKLFASDIIVTDNETKKTFEHRIEVNKPLVYKGVTVYQASFDDGGTKMNLRGIDLHNGGGKPLELEARVSETAKVSYANEEYAFELTGFRPINVENFGTGESDEKAAERSRIDSLKEHLGSGVRSLDRKDLRNVGPSFTYKLRDAAGQAREYHNYMLPLQLDGRWFYVSGMRATPNDQFRFLRMPLDENASFDTFLAMRAILLDPAQHASLAKRFALGEGAGSATLSADARKRLEEVAGQILRTFGQRGMQSVAEFLEKAVPEAEREKAAEIYLRLFQGVAWEASQMARERSGKSLGAPTQETTQFVQDAVAAISDSFLYGVPLYIQLITFDEVKASVFQLTRAPAKNIVYLGCLALVLGVFAMLYIRERRVWVLAKHDGRVLMAMSSNRKSLDLEREFERHRIELAALNTRTAHAR